VESSTQVEEDPVVV